MKIGFSQKMPKEQSLEGCDAEKAAMKSWCW
jgi:hypothetical protein